VTGGSARGFTALPGPYVDSAEVGNPVLEILDQARSVRPMKRGQRNVLRAVFGQVYEAKSSLSQALEKYPRRFRRKS